MDKLKEKEVEEILDIIPCPNNAEDLMTYAIWKYYDLVKKKRLGDSDCTCGERSMKFARDEARSIISREKWKWLLETIVLSTILNVLVNIFLF